MSEKYEAEPGITFNVDQTKLDAAIAELDNRRQDPAPATGSTVVTALEKVWTAIRANHPDLPVLVIVTGSGWVGSPRWGHHRVDGWTDRHYTVTQDGVTVNGKLSELFVAGECLAKGGAFTIETLLHEAAHVLAVVRGIQETSRQKRWHNERFRRLAEELGLEYPKDRVHPQIGFAEMVLTPGTRDEYAPVIHQLDAAIRLTCELPGFMDGPDGGDTDGDQPVPVGGEYIYHGTRGPREKTGPGSNNLKAVCGCEPARIIRVSRKVFGNGFIACELCHQSFELVSTRE